ncbi:MAG: c-type cytochrome, partial [Bryobacteraceae bacterium]
MVRISILAFCAALLAYDAPAQTVETGKPLFLARCAGCHGEDGRGGEHGPNIVDVRQPRASTKEAVLGLIRKGIPEAGMPAFQIPDSEAGAIADYVMSLKVPGRASVAKVAMEKPAPGDAAAGERFFVGEGNCASCHMVQGRGGVLGPDLSNVGRDRTPAQIEQALRDPGAVQEGRASEGRRGRSSYPAVTARLRDGRIVRGIAKNESPFDLQLLGMDGKLYLLKKEDVAEVIHEKSLMPKVEATPAQMRDLIAWLSRLTPGAAKFIAPAPGLGAGVPFADVAHPKPGTWPTYNGNESGNRFSPLGQINAANVQHLAPKWMFPLRGAPRSLEVTPVVVGGVMYVTSVNEAYALDARSG